MSGLFLVHVNNNEVGTRLFLKGLIWPRKQDIRFLGQKSPYRVSQQVRNWLQNDLERIEIRSQKNVFGSKKLLFKAFLRTAKN